MDIKKKQALDIALLATACALGVLVWFYAPENDARPWLLVLAAGLAVVFLVFLLLDLRRLPELPPPAQTGGPVPSELVLLSEQDTELSAWSLFGRVSLLIGCQRPGVQEAIDVDLSHATYASTIDSEHAVMNYSSGSWFVEDLYSKNGVSVQKASDGKKYRLISDQPCQIELGDVIFIGLTRLVLR